MRRLHIAVILISALALVQVIAVQRATYERRALPEADAASYIIPSKMTKVTMMEFDGLAADFIFLKALVFLERAKDRTETRKVNPWVWKRFSELINTVTDLDPYFVDPYYAANAYLPWDASMTQEANALLEKGSRHLDWDPALPFFLGFNYFYFLHDNEKAAEWLMTASRRPGASPLYASLAARLAYEDKKTENAIAFLEELLKRTDDENIKKQYEIRLLTLQGVFILETAVDSYKKKFHSTPPDLDALIEKQLIRELPHDPYGGSYYIDPEGHVRSTSDNKLGPHRSSLMR